MWCVKCLGCAKEKGGNGYLLPQRGHLYFHARRPHCSHSLSDAADEEAEAEAEEEEEEEDAGAEPEAEEEAEEDAEASESEEAVAVEEEGGSAEIVGGATAGDNDGLYTAIRRALGFSQTSEEKANLDCCAVGDSLQRGGHSRVCDRTAWI
jgi:hypothetical protein